jgi:hypothetical protein
MSLEKRRAKTARVSAPTFDEINFLYWRQFMVESSDVFEKNYKEYCVQIGKIDFGSIKNKLGAVNDGDRMSIPFFNNRYFVSTNGIVDESGNRPDYMICVILAKYILLCPDQSHYDNEWVSFKDFKRASHFTNVNYFSSDTERAIEKHFSGKLNELTKACEELDGSHHEMEISYDLSMQFNALPRVSLLLLFNDGDEEFPAKCTVLFQKRAEYYLDPWNPWTLFSN